MSIDLGKAAFGWVVVVWLTAPALLGFFIAYKVINIEKDIKTYVNDLPGIVAQGIVLDRTKVFAATGARLDRISKDLVEITFLKAIPDNPGKAEWRTVTLPAWQLELLFQFGSMEKANLDYQADADKSLALRSKEDEK
ncbi:hypothetical protein [uncultured Sutterella sp.]|uniref:hypothetical protein n=1 Tax=uncultured Sutterella sp. TaxID=286133 RepID=UPI00266DB33A|nr:hypothetical protein [uncultured Sutterella sp.]